jgi:hypothetical protein
MKGTTMGSREEGFRPALESLINRHSQENGSNTPDFILATYLTACLDAFDAAVVRREQWYGRRGENAPPPPSAELKHPR